MAATRTYTVTAETLPAVRWIVADVNHDSQLTANDAYRVQYAALNGWAASWDRRIGLGCRKGFFMAVKERNASLDIIRCVAIGCVVVVHSYWVVANDESLLGTIGVSLGSLGVPLFVMLTGYLMADRDYQGDYLSKFLKNNLLPLFVCFELWNLIHAGLSNIWIFGRAPYNIYSVIGAAFFFDNSGLDMLWYLPMILAVYLGMPVISLVFKKLGNTKYGLVLFCLAVYCSVLIPSLREVAYVLGWDLYISPLLSFGVFTPSVWGDSVWIVYVALGWMLKRGKFKRLTMAQLVFGIAVLFALYVAFAYHYAWTVGIGAKYSFVLVVAVATLLFEALSRIKVSNAHPVGKVAQYISVRSFGVYVVHYWLLCALLTLLPLAGLNLFAYEFNSLQGIPVLLLIDAVISLLSLATVEILALVKPLRKWLLLMK